MSYLYDDEVFGDGTDAPSVSAADTLANDMAEAVQMAMGDSFSQEWVGGIFNTAGYAQRQVFNEAPPKAVNAADDKKEPGGLIGKVSSWVEKNKGLSEMLAKGIAGAALGSQNKKAAEIQAQSRLDELKLRNQQEREKDAQVSASVSGLRAPGLIGRAQPLRRADGSMVYQQGRIV